MTTRVRLAMAAIAVGLVLYYMWRRHKVRGHTPTTQSVVGATMILAGLALMVPTTSVIALGMPPGIGALAGLAIGSSIGLILFFLVGPVGVAGAFGAKAAGLLSFMTLFGTGGFIGGAFGGIVRTVPVSAVSPLIWGSLLVFGFVLLRRSYTKFKQKMLLN